MHLLGSFRPFAFVFFLGLGACSTLPVAPVGAVPPKTPLALKEYKLRKHHIESLGTGYLTGTQVKVGAELMDLSRLEDYLRVQGRNQEADMVSRATVGNRWGLGLTVVGTVLLTPVMGLGLLIPYYVYPAVVASNNANLVHPASVQYNAYLSRLWLSSSPPPAVTPVNKPDTAAADQPPGQP